MTREQRAEVLRERFKAICIIHYVASGKPRKYRHNISGRPIYMAWQEANRNIARVGVWLHKADPKPKLIPRVNHRQGKSAVERIAEKAPKKLRRGFISSDHYLAARRRL